MTDTEIYRVVKGVLRNCPPVYGKDWKTYISGKDVAPKIQYLQEHCHISLKKIRATIDMWAYDIDALERSGESQSVTGHAVAREHPTIIQRIKRHKPRSRLKR